MKGKRIDYGDAKVAIVITPKGVSTVSFLPSEKSSLKFYECIEPSIRKFEASIVELTGVREGKNG